MYLFNTYDPASNALAFALLAAIALLFFFFLARRVIRFSNGKRHKTKSIEKPNDVVCTSLAEALPHATLFAFHEAFDGSANTYWSSSASEQRPRCIVLPRNAAEVSVAIKTLLKYHNGPQRALSAFAIKSGGHSPQAHFATKRDGIVIDLSSINEVTVAHDKSSATIGSGARWKVVCATLEAEGLATAGGRAGDVGVGGLTLGGGISYFSPRVGFVCSNIIEYEVVLADGAIVHASEERHEDLWRALKGGGNNFGIVTRLKVSCFESTSIWGGYLFLPIWNAEKCIRAFHNFTQPQNFDELAAGAIVGFVFTSSMRLKLIATSVVYTRPQKWARCWDEFRRIGRFWSTVKPRTLTDAVQYQSSLTPAGVRQFQCTCTVKNDLETLQKSYALWQRSIAAVRRVIGIDWCLIFQPLSTGMMSNGSLNSLGLGDRKESMVIVHAAVSWKKADDDELVESSARALIADIEKVATDLKTADIYKYLNYAARGQDVFGGYGEAMREFLLRTSRRYDPDRFLQLACEGGIKIGI